MAEEQPADRPVQDSPPSPQKDFFLRFSACFESPRVAYFNGNLVWIFLGSVSVFFCSLIFGAFAPFDALWWPLCYAPLDEKTYELEHLPWRWTGAIFCIILAALGIFKRRIAISFCLLVWCPLLVAIIRFIAAMVDLGSAHLE